MIVECHDEQSKEYIYWAGIVDTELRALMKRDVKNKENKLLGFAFDLLHPWLMCLNT